MRPFVYNASMFITSSFIILGITWYENEWKGFKNYIRNVRNNSWFIVHGIMGSSMAGLVGELLIKENN